MVDLDEAMALTERWVLLGDERVALVERGCEASAFERAAVRAVREEPGLSATLLHVLGEEKEAPLAELRYTHRQRRAVENIRFVIQQQLAGRRFRAWPTGVRACGRRPVRETQALVAGTAGRALRLLSYLRRTGNGWRGASPRPR